LIEFENANQLVYSTESFAQICLLPFYYRTFMQSTFLNEKFDAFVRMRRLCSRKVQRNIAAIYETKIVETFPEILSVPTIENEVSCGDPLWKSECIKMMLEFTSVENNSYIYEMADLGLVDYMIFLVKEFGQVDQSNLECCVISLANICSSELDDRPKNYVDSKGGIEACICFAEIIFLAEEYLIEIVSLEESVIWCVMILVRFGKSLDNILLDRVVPICNKIFQNHTKYETYYEIPQLAISIVKKIAEQGHTAKQKLIDKGTIFLAKNMIDNTIYSRTKRMGFSLLERMCCGIQLQRDYVTDTLNFFETLFLAICGDEQVMVKKACKTLSTIVDPNKYIETTKKMLYFVNSTRYNVDVGFVYRISRLLGSDFKEKWEAALDFYHMVCIAGHESLVTIILERSGGDAPMLILSLLRSEGASNNTIVKCLDVLDAFLECTKGENYIILKSQLQKEGIDKILQDLFHGNNRHTNIVTRVVKILDFNFQNDDDDDNNSDYGYAPFLNNDFQSWNSSHNFPAFLESSSEKDLSLINEQPSVPLFWF